MENYSILNSFQSTIVHMQKNWLEIVVLPCKEIVHGNTQKAQSQLSAVLVQNGVRLAATHLPFSQ